MKIKFWKRLSSDNNMHVDPTISAPILDLDGTLREGTSIITPEIVFESDEKILTCNYCYIQEFSRYYFVKDIQPLTNRIWKVSLNVDVLNSYKDYILSQTGFIERCDGTFNPDIEDKERDFEIEEEYEFIKTSDIMREGATIGIQPLTQVLISSLKYHVLGLTMKRKATMDLHMIYIVPNMIKLQLRLVVYTPSITPI